MARNNIKPLTSGQLEKLNAKYRFSYDDNDVIVTLTTYNRMTRHSRTDPFHINCKSPIKRKICFSVTAIEYWIRSVEQGLKYSLFDIQQAANILAITYQSIDYDAVLKVLNQKSSKIQRT